MSWEITKTFECDYGHRVHSQKLNKDYSLDGCLVCRHLHGHRMKVAITLQGGKLDDSSMVTDFKHLNWFKRFIDDVVDHKFIIDREDPLFERITGCKVSDIRWIEHPDVPDTSFGVLPLGGDPIVNEHLESFVVVQFVPTSEELSRWFFNIATVKMAPLGVKVSKVTFNETPKSTSVYTA